MNTAEAKRVLETALICANAPMQLPEMKALFDGELGRLACLDAVQVQIFFELPLQPVHLADALG